MGPLRRLDDAVLPTLHRVAERAVAPVRALRRWEADPARGRLLRRLVRSPGTVAVLAGVVVVGAGAVHAERFEMGTPSTAPVAREVGPRVGVDVDRYVDGRHGVLDGLAADVPTRAIVSFTTTVPLEDLPLPAGVEVEALQLVVPGQEREPRHLDLAQVDDPPARVAQLLRAERGALAEEIEELSSTLEEDLGDPDFEADFRRRLEDLEAARAALAGDPELVFAAVVVGDAAELRRLRERAEVRLVDPAGPAADTRDARFHGLVPSDRERVEAGRPL